MIEMESQIKKEFAEINSEDRGIITLGISHTRGRVFLPRIFPQFHKKYPNVELVLKEGNSRLLEAYLKDGTVDMVIAANHFSKVETEVVPLFMERLFWVIPNAFLTQKYGNEKPQDIDIKEFYNYPFVLMIKENRIRAMMDKYYHKIGMEPNVLLESDNIETTFSLAHQGMGITIYPEMFLYNLSPMLKNEDSVSYYPVNDISTISELVIAYKKERYINKFEREFIDICVKQSKNNT
jgi:DNA-binding transcriptional LysR family regulator